MSFVRGGLKFKSNFQTKLQTEQKILRRDRLDKINEKEGIIDAIPKMEKERGTKTVIYDVKPGTGRIIISGKSVHGKDTLFTQEVTNGDTIIIRNSKTMEKESAVISMVLSDKSLSLKEHMSGNIITYT